MPCLPPTYASSSDASAATGAMPFSSPPTPSSACAAASAAATRSRKMRPISSAFSNTSAGLRSMSPGLGSSFLVDRLRRPRSPSLLRISTFSSSPGASTFSTATMRSCEICEMCSRPLMPPTSTKAPYGFTACTMPLHTSPTPSPSPATTSDAFLFDITRRFFSSSTSRNLTGMVWPTSSSRLRERMAMWLWGTNPRRCSTSTRRPPRLTDSTTPVMAVSSACIVRHRSQAASS
mmetsp:Transcript_40056/g.99133  ORF Transcript_40056/g.99133 Transcript_40056/m.99133 type:complete len:234 (+) Transcript_40056:223-924(+)